MSLYIAPFFRGLFLGSSVVGISFVLDRSVSKESYVNMDIEDIHLYHQGINANIVNLCMMSPVLYSILVVNIVRVSGLSIYTFNPYHIMCLVFIHNVFYYLVHKSFHLSKRLQDIHHFHHKFDRLMLPSVGNAVSKREFLFAYITPFYIGAFIVPCSETSLLCSVAIIAALNMCIHCKEIENTTWPKWLVSPKKHITHHIVRKKHYAAPFLDLDHFLEIEDESKKE